MALRKPLLFTLAAICLESMLTVLPTLSVVASPSYEGLYVNMDGQQATLDGFETDKRRLRFVRRGDFGSSPRQIRDPRLRFAKRDPDGNVDSSYMEERQIRDPRLRFAKKDLDANIESGFIESRQIRDPRLRFPKREAVLHPEMEIQSGTDSESEHKQIPVQNEEADEILSRATAEDLNKEEHHSRKRRSALFSSLSSVGSQEALSRPKRWSFDTDMDVIRAMMMRLVQRRRAEECNRIRAAMLEAGKRSASMPPTDNEDTAAAADKDGDAHDDDYTTAGISIATAAAAAAAAAAAGAADDDDDDDDEEEEEEEEEEEGEDYGDDDQNHSVDISIDNKDNDSRGSNPG
ncbi:ELH precursor [Plakobranchus ocellatus]|uniref:ELH n=1 Tax=Plakobranchus ocellatus TaxID=259542 RepID=A0AAV3YUN0_9GAST|nr:ELH precursor [Plakobranchus ocellatus]